MLKLADIPNLPGYRFTGIDKDGVKHQCEVYKDRSGLHRVKGISFADLEGWERLPKDQCNFTEAFNNHHSPAIKPKRKGMER